MELSTDSPWQALGKDNVAKDYVVTKGYFLSQETFLKKDLSRGVLVVILVTFKRRVFKGGCDQPESILSV